jgi:DNA-binding transcriptional LysR family regulator
MTQWRKMEVFIAVVERGNLAKAAELLDISSTAVGKWIQNLESTSQEPLFNRAAKKLVLTSFGKEYYQTCKSIQNGMQQANLLINSKNEDLHGKLRLHAPAFIAAIVVIPVLAKFKCEHPNLDITLTVGDNIPNLLEEDYDILIGYEINSLSSQPDLRACHLDKGKNILAASPEYLNKFGEPTCFEELIEHQFIHHSLLPQPFKITTALGETTPDLETSLMLGDQRLLCVAALNGMGIIYTGNKILLPEICRRKLRRVLPEIDLGETIIAAFYKKTPQDQPKVRKFLDHLKHHFENNMPTPNRCLTLLEKLDKIFKQKK